jgi:hypothetical protein
MTLATFLLELVLEIGAPALVVLIIVAILLYKCIRKVQDALSEGEFELGMRLAYHSDEQSSDSSDRDRAMWIGDEEVRTRRRDDSFFLRGPTPAAEILERLNPQQVAEESDGF